MSFLNRNFIVIYLIFCIAGIFAFHWFFIDNMMPASECFSVNCIYSSPQAINREARNNLLISLIIILFLALFSSIIWLNEKIKRIFANLNIFRKLAGVFDFKITFWLKILEKRDPRAVFALALISDFRQ